MKRLWWSLGLLCIVAFVGDHAGWPPTLVFLLAGGGTIPAAVMLGRATEEIALGITAREVAQQQASGQDVAPSTRGAKVGGLLNATFGNVPELFIGILALRQGYVSLTQATIVGSVIGNAALVLGLALFFGGLKHGTQRFDPKEAGHHAVLMALAVAALVLPSMFFRHTSGKAMQVSVVAAVLLLGIYVAYVLFSLFGLQGGPAGQSGSTFIDDQAAAIFEMGDDIRAWPRMVSILVLAAATVLVFGASEALVDSVVPFTRKLHWTPFFVGIVIVPVLGNLAEQSSAILLARRNKVNTALGVASGSSIQVAVFVAPILVLLSLLTHHLTLVFMPIEIAVLAMVTVMFFLVSQDGESNWLEGLQLVVLYGIAATVMFFVQGTF